LVQPFQGCLPTLASPVFLTDIVDANTVNPPEF